MFREMRKKQRELDLQEAKSILQKGEYGILSTMGTDGYPYGVPVNYAFAENKIYFHCAPSAGHKLANIEACPRVCFTVVGETQVLPAEFSTRYESAIAFGTASKAKNKEKALELLIQKYSPDYLKEGREYITRSSVATGVYEITIEHLTGKGRR